MRSPLQKVFAEDMRIENSAARDMQRLHIHEGQLRRYVAANVVFAIPEGRLGFRSLVFEPNPHNGDRGFVITGERRGGRTIVQGITASRYADEADYFHAVAALHDLKPLTVGLRRPILNCRNYMIKGWVLAKLWLKHRLNVNDVTDILENSTEPILDGEHFNARPRYFVEVFDRDQRPLRAVVEDRGGCPAALVTAFEVR